MQPYVVKKCSIVVANSSMANMKVIIFQLLDQVSMLTIDVKRTHKNIFSLGNWILLGCRPTLFGFITHKLVNFDQ